MRNGFPLQRFLLNTLPERPWGSRRCPSPSPLRARFFVKSLLPTDKFLSQFYPGVRVRLQPRLSRAEQLPPTSTRGWSYVSRRFRYLLPLLKSLQSWNIPSRSPRGRDRASPPNLFSHSDLWVSPFILLRTPVPPFICAGSSIEFGLKRFHDPLPSLMLQYWTARSTVAKLQTEKQTLQLQLRALQHHLSLHKLHVQVAHETETEAKRQKDTYHDNLRLLEERRRILIDSHSSSVHGTHAAKYRALLAEHLQLEDQFRQITASRTVIHYRLQKLIIDVSHGQNEVALQPVCGSSSLCRLPPLFLTLCS